MAASREPPCVQTHVTDNVHVVGRFRPMTASEETQTSTLSHKLSINTVGSTVHISTTQVDP